MHSLRTLVLCAMVCFPAIAEAQNITIACGSLALAMDALEVFTPRFVSADSEFVHNREQNGLRGLVPGEQPQPVTDAAICGQLAAKVAEDLATTTYWSRATYIAAYMRFGPYYAVYIKEQHPPDYVGTVWGLVLFDVQTLARIPIPYDCNC